MKSWTSNEQSDILKVLRLHFNKILFFPFFSSLFVHFFFFRSNTNLHPFPNLSFKSQNTPLHLFPSIRFDLIVFKERRKRKKKRHVLRRNWREKERERGMIYHVSAAWRKKEEGRQRALSKPRSGRIICKNGILSTLTSEQGDMGECVHVRTPSPLLLEHIRRGNNNCDSLYGVLDEWNSAVEIKLQRRTPLAAKSHPLDVGQWFNYSVARHFDAGPRTSLSLSLSLSS